MTFNNRNTKKINLSGHTKIYFLVKFVFIAKVILLKKRTSKMYK